MINLKIFKQSILIFLFLTFVCGVAYPLLTFGVGQILFSKKVNGSIVVENNFVIGSELLGQEFTKAKYLIGRPTLNDNLSPTSLEAKKVAEDRLQFLKSLDPKNNLPVPSDLIYNSASGRDPHISFAAAEYQIDRIARERNISVEEVRNIILENKTKKLIGIFGEEGVNVLKVNISLDAITNKKS